jgi:hypothetical protein
VRLHRGIPSPFRGKEHDRHAVSNLPTPALPKREERINTSTEP